MPWSKKYKDDATDERGRALDQQLEDELHPKRKWLHRFFVLVSIISGCSAFLMAVGQIVGLTVGSVGPIQYVIRAYIVFFCFLVIFNELEWTKLTKDSVILRWWVSRGVTYAFFGCLGLDQNSNIPADENKSDSALVFIKVIAWMVIGCGILYFVLGVACLQIVCNSMRDDYQKRLERAKEVRRTTERYMRHDHDTV